MTEPTPVVFVHGLWLHASSWDNWVTVFDKAGYAPTAPGWPGDSDTADECRAHPENVSTQGIEDVVSHYVDIIAGLPAKPIVIGHSFGGLIVQRLLAEGHATAAVAIDPAPIKGVIYLPPSALRVASIALRNPANRNKAVSLSEKQFKYGFGNELSPEESRDLYEKFAIPSPGRPLFEAASANLSGSSPAKVDTKNSDRGPLLITAGGKDHTVPAAVSRSTLKQYRHSTAVTDFKEFSDRGHSLGIDHGWEDVATYALDWLKRHSL